MKHDFKLKTAERGRAEALAGIPCETCRATGRKRSADGTYKCKSSASCTKYKLWFGARWRAVCAPFREGGQGGRYADRQTQKNLSR